MEKNRRLRSGRRSIRPQFRGSRTLRPSRPSPSRSRSQRFRTRVDFTPWRPGLTTLAYVGILGILVVLIQHFFIIRRVNCILNHQSLPCSQSLIDASQQLLGKPLLLTNLGEILEASRSERLAFDRVNYYKILPDRVVVDFYFPEPVYVLATEQGEFGFSQDGRYTILPADESTLTINVASPRLRQQLVDFQLDPVVHQKFLDLLAYSEGERAEWQAVQLENLNQLRIVTAQADYLVDPFFDLAENLAKLAYLEKNRHSPAHQEIDLRLKIPVVRSLN